MLWWLGHDTNMDVKVNVKAFNLSKWSNDLSYLWTIPLDIQISTYSGL